MLRLYHAWREITWILIFVFAEGRRRGDTPPCSGAQITSDSRTPSIKYTVWSSCKRINEEDGSRPGCYSGEQQRVRKQVRNETVKPSETNIQRVDECMQYRRCLVPGRTCEGYWGLWVDNDECNCTTNSRKQTRYCYERQNNVIGQSSIHCFGSDGKPETSRMVVCAPQRDKCPKTTKKEERKKVIDVTTTAAHASKVTDLSPSIRNLAATDFGKISITNANGDPFELSVTHIATIAVCGVLFLLVIIGAMLLCKQRNGRFREHEKLQNSRRHTVEDTAATQPNSDGDCYTRANDLYINAIPYQNRAMSTSTQASTSPLTTSATTNLTLSHAAEDQEDIYWTIAP